MKINSSYILLKEIRCYAYHGVAPQENLIGNEYIIDLKLKVDISKATRTDEVADTVNYAEVHQVIKNEMAVLLSAKCRRRKRLPLFFRESTRTCIMYWKKPDSTSCWEKRISVRISM